MSLIIRNSIVVILAFAGPFAVCSQSPQNQKGDKILLLSMQLMKNNGHDSLPNIKITIKNKTDTLASFYEDWNVWGDHAIQLELIMNDKLLILHHAGCWDDKNFPSAKMLFPGDSLIFYYTVRQCMPQNCNCFYTGSKEVSFPKDHLKGATIRAVYQNDLENHKILINETKRERGQIFWSIAFSSRHAKKFAKLSAEQKLRSFVSNKLISQSQSISFDAW